MSISKKPTASSRNPNVAQSERFIEAAREAGCSEDEAEIRESMKRLATAKVAHPVPAKK